MPSSISATDTMSYCTMTSTGTNAAIELSRKKPTQRDRSRVRPAVRAMSMTFLAARARKKTIMALSHSCAGTELR